MNILSLFSAKGMINGIKNGADALHLSGEEKIEGLKSIQDQYGPRALSRRLIALIMSFNFSAAFLTGLIFACCGKKEVVDSIVSLVGAFRIGIIMVTIIIFYFGYYGIKSIIKK